MHSVRAMHLYPHMQIGIIVVHMPPKLVLAKTFHYIMSRQCAASNDHARTMKLLQHLHKPSYYSVR